MATPCRHVAGHTRCGCCHERYPTFAEVSRHQHEILRRKCTAGEQWFTIKDKDILRDGQPADDHAFIYGQSPVHKDGTFNGPGQFADPTVYAMEEEQKKLQKQGEKSWTCRHPECSKLVDRPPREWVPRDGKSEPVDWWWCEVCRLTKKKPSAKEMKHIHEAKKCRKLQDFFTHTSN